MILYASTFFCHLLYFKIKTKKSLYGRIFDVANIYSVIAVEYLWHIQGDICRLLDIVRCF